MKLAIVGQPGTNNTHIAQLIADRYDTELITVHSVLNPDEEFNLSGHHENVEFDREVTQRLKKLKDTYEDYVLCCDTAQLIAPEATSVLLTYNYLFKSNMPHVIYALKNTVRNYVKRDLDEEVYVPESFDIAIDVTGVFDTNVAEAVIQALSDDYKGNLLPARALFPTVPVTEVNYDCVRDHAAITQVTKNESVFYVIGDHSQYRAAVELSGLLRVKQVKKRNIHKCTYDEILGWIRYCYGGDFRWPMFERLLSMYCADNGFSSRDAAFLALKSAGDPYTILSNSGYTIG